MFHNIKQRLKFDEHGYSEYTVLNAREGWFVGYVKQEDDGLLTEYRMSGYYPNYDQAEQIVEELTKTQNVS